MQIILESNFANGGDVEIAITDKSGEEIERFASFNKIFNTFLTKSVKSRTSSLKVLTWFESNFKNWIKNDAVGYDSHNNFYAKEADFKKLMYPDFQAILDDLEDEFPDIAREDFLAMFPEYIRKNPAAAQIFAGGRVTRMPRLLNKITDELIDYLNAVANNQEERNYDVLPEIYFVRDLTKVPPTVAIENARSYHVYLERMSDKISKIEALEKFKVLKRGTDFQVVDTGVTLPPKVRLVKALSPLFVKTEGSVQGHCVGTYADKVTSGSIVIWSLQDAEGLPVATFELSRDLKTIFQLKGPKNGPIRPEFHDVLRNIIVATKLKFQQGGGYGSSDYKLMGLSSSDLNPNYTVKPLETKGVEESLLYVPRSIKESYRSKFLKFLLEEDEPQKRTISKDKFRTKLDDLKFSGSDDKNLPASKSGTSKDGSEKSFKLNTASASDTGKATKNVRMDMQSLFLFMGMDLSGLEDEIDMRYDLMVPTPTDLPKVINSALKAAGKEDPKWHMVRNLPGYMSQGIRAIGRQVFSPFTTTRIEDIQVVANIGGGPNTKKEIDAVASFLVKFGTKINDASMEFQERIPGYRAEMKVYTFANYTFLIVKDHAGEYIYSWPSTDNKKPIADKSLLGK